MKCKPTKLADDAKTAFSVSRGVLKIGLVQPADQQLVSRMQQDRLKTAVCILD